MVAQDRIEADDAGQDEFVATLVAVGSVREDAPQADAIIRFCYITVYPNRRAQRTDPQ